MADHRNPIGERNPMRRDDEEVGRTNEEDFIGQADDDEDMDDIDEIEDEDEDLEA